MAYTPVTQVPFTLLFFQWSRPESPNPRLASPIDTTTTTIKVTSAPKDKDGVVITGNFIMGIRDVTTGYVESVYVPNASSTDGLTFTGVVRKLRLEGLDFTTSSSELTSTGFDQDSPVFCQVSGIEQNIIYQALLGQIGDTYKLNAPPTYMGVGLHRDRVFADATARDTAITSPQNGDRCYNTATGTFQKYQTGSWQDDATGTTPNASTTVAGKIELATQAENDAGTATGGTGASLVATPAIQAVTFQKGMQNFGASSVGTDSYAITLVPAISAYTLGARYYFYADVANTGTASLNVNGLGAQTIYKLVNGSPVVLENNDIIAGSISEVIDVGGSFYLLNPTANQMSTVNKVDLTDGGTTILHTHSQSIAQFNRTSTDASGNEVVAHGLGTTPKSIIVFAKANNSNATGTNPGKYVSMSSEGSSNFVNNKCTYIRQGEDTGTSIPIADNDGSTCIHIESDNVGSTSSTKNVATCTADATNLTFAFTKTSGASDDSAYEIYVTVICFS